MVRQYKQSLSKFEEGADMPLVMKILLKSLKWILIGIFVVVIMLFAFIYYIEVKKPENIAMKNILNQNPNISKIYSLKNIKGWGEGPEYSGIVEINGERCRIWTSGDGKIDDIIILSQ